MYILLCPRIKHSHVSSAIINWPRDWTAEKFIFINFRFFNIKPIHPPPAVAGGSVAACKLSRTCRYTDDRKNDVNHHGTSSKEHGKMEKFDDDGSVHGLSFQVQLHKAPLNLFPEFAKISPSTFTDHHHVRLLRLCDYPVLSRPVLLLHPGQMRWVPGRMAHK